MVGGRGNEGKSFCVEKIEDQYETRRVFSFIGLWLPTWYIFEDHEGDVDVAADIFLFNIYRGICKERINYVLLENIMNGGANVVMEGNVKRVRFTAPNVIIVFSYEYPDTGKFSEDRGLFFKINAGMELEDVTEARLDEESGARLDEEREEDL